MSRVFDFKEQLKIGNRGENLFLDLYPSWELVKENHADFRCTDTGDLIELKTDTYGHDKTPNFFIERYSNYQRKTPGSIWQAHKNGASRFYYYFINSNVYYEFLDIKKVIDRVEKLCENQGYVLIPNKGWTTAGWKVSREALDELWEYYEIEE